MVRVYVCVDVGMAVGSLVGVYVARHAPSLWWVDMLVTLVAVVYFLWRIRRQRARYSNALQETRSAYTTCKQYERDVQALIQESTCRLLSSTDTTP